MPKEIRSSGGVLQSENDGRTVVGYAAVFNSPTDIGGMWSEVIEPGSFTATLSSSQDVLALYSHEIERLLGRESAGTLRLKEDDKGLAVEIDLPDTTDGRDVGVLIQRGDLKGMSFGFMVTKQEWDETVTPPKRTIMAVDLYEVTITADPAYPDTEIGMAELAEARAKRRTQNFNAAAKRLAMKATVDLRARGVTSKA